jgi:6-hydroxy-3-succinoylpyridine 3-monooxygenase
LASLYGWLFSFPRRSDKTTGMRAIVYIDGFNLYYGAIRGGPHKWLNLERFFRLMRQSDQIERIYYFTALVDGPSLQRQETYLQALSTCPLVSVILGKYKTKRVLAMSLR